MIHPALLENHNFLSPFRAGCCQIPTMDGMMACTECGFTTTSAENFTSHIEHHEEEHRSSSGELSTSQTVEWNAGSSSSSSSTPSPTGSLSDHEKTPSPPLIEEVAQNLHLELLKELNVPVKLESTVIKEGGKSNKTVHVCPHCNFSTYMSQHMKSHLEAHERHQGQMYQCDICNMQFSQKANMHRHRMRHTGVKPYECRYCKKRFFRKDQMQEHSMTHIKTGADFDCPVLFCKQQFSQHSQLRTHLDDAHNISASAPASCKRCSLLFANSRRLLLHYQTRHDENEPPSSSSPTSPTEKDHLDVPPPTKKRRSEASSQYPITEQIQQLVKQESLSPQATEASSSALDLSESAMPQGYPLTNEEILMMCLANTSGLAQSALMAVVQNKITMEQNLRLWPIADQITALQAHPQPETEAHSPSFDSGSSNVDVAEDAAPPTVAVNPPSMECNHCGIVFFDQTMHLLHKGLHTEDDPWRCNLCGIQCCEKYMFSTHVIFANHSS